MPYVYRAGDGGIFMDVAMLKDIKSEWNLIRYKNDGNKVKSFSVVGEEKRKKKT